MTSPHPAAASREPDISVVIPAVNEGEKLREAIGAVHSATIPFELIVVDGGSSDDTAEVARASGARVVHSYCRQRAHQLNLGAQHAVGATLLFLHADTTLPEQAIEKIVEAMSRPDVAGGAFARRYASPSFVLRATCLLARCRNHLIGWHLGDQAMFVRRAVFFRLGGFREVDLFEDLDFSRRLKHFGHIVTLTPGVTSSARRFEKGATRTTLRDFGLTMRYLIEGLPPSQSGADVRPTLLS
jgi:rSAM/selenodomain-associated transferase 2